MSSSRKRFLYMLDRKLGDVIETNKELTDLDDGLDEILSVIGRVGRRKGGSGERN